MSAIVTADADLNELRKKATAVPQDAAATERAALTAIMSIQKAVETYDKCNTVTAERKPYPFPAIELVMYGIIAVVFIGVAAAVIGQLAPADSADNLRALYGMRANVIRGDSKLNMASINRLVSCNEPPDFIWSMFVWFGLIALLMLTVWFMISQRDVADSYQMAINIDADCVE